MLENPDDISEMIAAIIGVYNNVGTAEVMTQIKALGDGVNIDNINTALALINNSRGITGVDGYAEGDSDAGRL